MHVGQNLKDGSWAKVTPPSLPRILSGVRQDGGKHWHELVQHLTQYCLCRPEHNKHCGKGWNCQALVSLRERLSLHCCWGKMHTLDTRPRTAEWSFVIKTKLGAAIFFAMKIVAVAPDAWAPLALAACSLLVATIFSSYQLPRFHPVIQCHLNV